MASKKKEDSSNEADSKDMLSSFLKNNEENHFNYLQPEEVTISSGSLGLDTLIKVRSGSFVRVCGKGSELGKTSQCFVFSQNYMDKIEKSKTIFIKAEARLTPEMQKRTGMKFVTDPSDWEYGTVFVFSCNVFETIASLIESILPKMHEAGEKLCIILDSLDGVILKSDKEKNLWNGDENVKVAGVPLLTKILFKRLALKIVHFDALFLITSQYTADIKLDPYSKTPPRQSDGAGGSAINHQSDITLSYQPRYGGDYILEKPNEKPDPVKNKVLGVYATIEIKKSSTDVTGSKVKIPIKKGRSGCAIWVEKEVVDMIISFELVTKKGAWYSFSESIVLMAKDDGVEIQTQHQGMSSLYDYIENNKSVFEWLLKKVKEIIS